MIGQKDGELYHIWQRERDASWSDWEKLGGLPSSTFMSQPTMVFDDNGWWQAYGVDLCSYVVMCVHLHVGYSAREVMKKREASEVREGRV